LAEQRTKLEAVIRLGRHLPHHPEMTFFLGFLAGNLDRLHFVRTLEGAPVAISIAAGRRHIWPGSVFEATVHHVPVPMPGAVVSALVENDEPICVRVSLDDAADAAWFEPLLLDSYHSAVGHRPEDTLAERVETLRGKIDQQLDIYRECRRLLSEGEGEDESRLRFFLGLAQTEIEGFGRELTDLNGRLQQRGQGGAGGREG
jgi:hypothetical protein